MSQLVSHRISSHVPYHNGWKVRISYVWEVATLYNLESVNLEATEATETTEVTETTESTEATEVTEVTEATETKLEFP